MISATQYSQINLWKPWIEMKQHDVVKVLQASAKLIQIRIIIRRNVDGLCSNANDGLAGVTDYLFDRRHAQILGDALSRAEALRRSKELRYITSMVTRVYL